jgi:hypothetical protein
MAAGAVASDEILQLASSMARASGEGRWSSTTRIRYTAQPLTPDPRLPHHPGMDRRRFLVTSVAGAR